MVTEGKQGARATHKMDEPVPVTAAVIEREGLYLIGRRNSGRFIGKWEFPGGKLEPGETARECLKRELKEELGVETAIGLFLQEIVWPYTHMTVRLLVYRAAITSGEPQAVDHSELRWVPAADLPLYDFPDADKPVIERLTKDTRDGMQV
jgi:8-oxo-dGTP diphosphatase